MKIFRGFQHPGIAPACALTIGNFDGVHRGHQAMLALLNSEAAHRGVPSCVLTFEPHPRDYFAAARQRPELAPARIGTLRDKLAELAACGVQQTVVLPFNESLARQPAQGFIDEVLMGGLGARYVLVGDDFRFGAQRAGDYALLDKAGRERGFDVARMNSYEVHGLAYPARPCAMRSRAATWKPPPPCSAGPTPSAAMWCMAASSGATWAPAARARATVSAR